MEGTPPPLSSIYSSAAEVLLPVAAMKEQLLAFFYNDDEFRSLVRWARKQSVVQSVDRVGSGSDVSSALESIESNCIQHAEDLAQSSVILCVYGSVNVGKSSFCNLLLGKSLLHVTNVQCTAVSAVVSSSPTVNNAKVIFAENGVYIPELIESKQRDLENLKEVASWQRCSEVLLRLHEKKETLFSNRVTLDNIEQLSVVSSLYPNLRQEKIFERIEISAPILGITYPGVQLTDCPGTRENEFLNHVAKSGVQHSSIVFFIMNCFSGLSEDDVRFLSCQARNGSSVLFVFNKKEEDTEDLLEERLFTIRTLLYSYDIFKGTPIFIIDVKKESQYVLAGKVEKEKHSAFHALLHHMLSCIYAKSNGMIFQFCKSLYHQLHSYFLLLSKIISYKMRIDSRLKSSSKKSFLSLHSSAIEEEMVRLSKSIATLMATCQTKMEAFKIQLGAFYITFLKKMTPKLLIIARESKVKAEYKPNDNSWFRNIMDSLTMKEATPFEEELHCHIIGSFVTAFATEYADWITSVRAEFTQFLLQEADKIQNTVNSLRNKLTKANVSVEMHDLLGNTEKQILNTVAAHFTIAGPVVSLLATGVGIGAPMALVGVVSAGFLTGGIAILAGVAITGIAASMLSINYVQKINNQSEESAREAIHKNAISSLVKWKRSQGFDLFATTALDSCSSLIKLVESTLTLSIAQVESLIKPLDISKISYEDLCNYLYMREKTESKIQELFELLKKHDTKGEVQEISKNYISSMKAVANLARQNVLGKSATDEFIGCRHPQCFVCKNEFISCLHICSSCRVSLQDSGNHPCPVCHKGLHALSTVSANPNFTKILEDFLFLPESDPEATASALPSEEQNGSLPFYSNEKARINEIILKKRGIMEEFIAWFNSTYKDPQGSQLITARNTVHTYISSFSSSLTRQREVPELYRKMLIECLHEILYPEIYNQLFAIYTIHFHKKDALIVTHMTRLHNLPPSAYSEENWGDDMTEKFLPAIECIKKSYAEPNPLQKMKFLIQCYREFEKAIPESMAVGADLLVPTLFYFLIQSEIPHLFSLFAFMLDALDKTDLLGLDQEYLFSTFQSLVFEFPALCSTLGSPQDAQ